MALSLVNGGGGEGGDIEFCRWLCMLCECRAQGNCIALRSTRVCVMIWGGVYVHGSLDVVLPERMNPSRVCASFLNDTVLE